MNLKGLRTLNLIGVILFCIIGSLLALVNYYQYYEVATHFNEDLTQCNMIFIIWIMIIILFTPLLYRYTVVALDRGEYKTAKSWTVVGIVIGFAGGIIPLVIFIVSFASFDDAVRSSQYGRPNYYPSPPPSQIRYCNRCRRPIPFDSKLCPYCGVQQPPMPPPYPPPPV